MKICILGDTGLLGQAFTSYAMAGSKNQVLGISTSPAIFSVNQKNCSCSYQHQIINVLDDSKKTERAIRDFSPNILLNCVALADVKRCQEIPDLAVALNVSFPLQLAKISAQNGFQMVHFSTDQVFDGRKMAPYKENDPTNPLHIYGATKRKGEKMISGVNPRALIIRTNIIGFRGRRDQPTFSEWLCNALSRMESIVLFEDFITSSIHVRDLATIVFILLSHGASGIHHAASRDFVSKYEFGSLLAKTLGFNFSNIKKGYLKGSSLYPPRPGFLALNVEKTEAAIGCLLPSVKDAIGKVAEDFLKHAKEMSCDT